MTSALQLCAFLVIFSRIAKVETSTYPDPEDISKVLVVAGWSNDNNAPSEVIDLVNASNSCQVSSNFNMGSWWILLSSEASIYFPKCQVCIWIQSKVDELQVWKYFHEFWNIVGM